MSEKITTEPFRWRHLVAGLVLWVALAATATAGAQEPQYLRMATGGIAGTYYPIGNLIAAAVSNPPGSRPCDKGGSCGVPGLVVVVESSNGSIDNVEMIGAGEVELALSQADIAYWAYHGTGPFAKTGPIRSLRAIANLFEETMHVVVRRDSGITGIGQLAGKRVSLGEPASGTLIEAKAVLAAYGLDEFAIDARFLAPGAASLALAGGEIDAFFFVGGYPVGGVAELARTVDIALLPIEATQADELIAFYPFLARTVIPKGTYHGVAETPTIGVGAQLLVADGVDADLVYGITRALWHPHTRKLLDRGHPKGREIKREGALIGIGIPLHDGAERYYREVGMLAKTP